MPANIVADTNIFYDVGINGLDLTAVMNPGERLCYSPVSVVEIAGKLSDLEHKRRKAAAKAIIEPKAEQLPDPESFLAHLFGHNLAQDPADWSQVVKAVAQSEDMAELQSGVVDFEDGVLRTVRPAVAGDWRAKSESLWEGDTLRIMKREIPSFAKWYDTDPTKRRGPVPVMRGKEKAAVLEKTTTMEWKMELTVMLHRRILPKADASNPFRDRNPATSIASAIEGVGCFAAIYTQCLIRLLTNGALPNRNDRGDIDLFCYSVSDDWIILTREKKWGRLAQRAGFPQRVRRV